MPSVETRPTAEGLEIRTISQRKTWNDLVQSFAAYDLRQGFEWGEMRREQGWRIRRFAVFGDGVCLAAASLQYRQLPPLGAIIYAPRGPLWRPEMPTGLASLLDNIRRFAAAIGGISLRASPGIPDDQERVAAQLREHGFRPLADMWSTWNVPRHIQMLDLTPDEAELLRGVRERYRRYIRNVGRKEISIEQGQSEDDLAAFHRLLQKLGRLKQFPVREFGHYQRLFDRYAHHGDALLLLARTEADVVGGLLAFRLGRRVYVHASSVRADGPRPLHGVAPALFWDCIRRAKTSGAQLIDFGSSGVGKVPDPSHRNYGLFQFKAGLGCRFVSCLPYQDLVFRRLAYRAFRRAETSLLPRVHRLLARAPALIGVIKRAV
ncbi:MAG TPA: peptidoglycan bridge formation glycyltransferase FemA/FemB family protein [Methylomirabilota bacterium]|jgi:lipid II:glycine glycyltransferase (peptidoglycan interpeptide bridge formation enzyme)|nr:peptidoglycan bridge formation glycyltransferase FemA/FemB family protein [Methylomirabilota bacterium]